MAFTELDGAYFILGVILIGWVLGIIVPPVTAWNKSRYLDQWAGENTARFRWKGYWWGYNKNTKSAFLIYNGPRLSFQVQTWKPRFAVWGIFKKRRLYIGLKQWIAKNFCVKAGGNTWYGSDIKHPYNVNVLLSNHQSIAVGSIQWKQLLQAIRYARSQKLKSVGKAVNETLNVFCECASFDCAQVVQLDANVLLGIRKVHGLIIIDGCTKGPSSKDTLLEKRSGYSIYLESVH